MKVVISGGTGFIGGIYRRHFADRADGVVMLVRRPILDLRERQVVWDAQNSGEWQAALEGADVLINLCGRSVNCRYNEANMAEIYASRLDPTRALAQAIRNCANPPKVWLNAASATIYRHEFERPMDEESGVLGTGFSVDVCQNWEAAFFETELPKTRRVAMRQTMIMGADPGGPFEAYASVAKMGLGGPMAGGRQFVSWIHELDLCRATDFLIAHSEIEGIVNLAAPNPLPNRDFMSEIVKAIGIKIALPTPEWALAIGAFARGTETELILKSRRVMPKRLLDAGFEFKFPTWPEAAKEIVGRA